MEKQTLQQISDKVLIELARLFMKTEVLAPREIAQLSQEVDLVQTFQFDDSKLLQIKLVIESNYGLKLKNINKNSKSVVVQDIINQLIIHSNDDSLFRWLSVNGVDAA